MIKVYTRFITSLTRVMQTYEIQSEINVRVFTLGDYKTIGSKNPRFVGIYMQITRGDNKGPNNDEMVQ